MHNGNLLTRPDTFFGVCEAIGQDFGFHPNFLRIAFAGFAFWNPAGAVAAYAATALVVALTRWLYPSPQPTAAAEAPEAPAAGPVVEEQAPEAEPVPLAA